MIEGTAQSVLADSNNVDAWNEWFKAMYPRVYYTLYRRTGGNADLSQECTQAAMERFLRYRGYEKVQTDREATAYLVRVALNVLADEHRSAVQVESIEGDIAETRGSSEEWREQLNLAGRRLKHSERELLERICAGYSTREVASQLGISYRAAATRIYRLKKRIAVILANLSDREGQSAAQFSKSLK